MKFDAAYFDRGISRRHTGCEKWDDPAVLGEGGIPLWVADMDFPCAPPIAQAIARRAEHACYGYNAEDPGEEQALISYWRRRHGVGIRPGDVQALPCVITGLKACVRAFTGEGDPVAILTPVYGPFYEAVTSNGRKVLSVPLLRQGDGRYEMDLNTMEDALRAGARLMMLCSPHNPVSRLWTKEELAALCSLAQKYDVPMVCDEIHADFVYKPGAFTSILSVPQGRERAVMLCSASKTFNVAGLQQAALVCPNGDMLSALRQDMKASGVTSGNTFARLAARTAYTACDDWLDGLLEYLDGSRAYLETLVKTHVGKAVASPIQATYLAWLDLRAYGMTCREMTEKCKTQGVALTPGTFFGPEGEGFMRVNFGCPRSQLAEGIRRLGKAMEE